MVSCINIPINFIVFLLTTSTKCKRAMFVGERAAIRPIICGEKVSTTIMRYYWGSRSGAWVSSAGDARGSGGITPGENFGIADARRPR